MSDWRKSGDLPPDAELQRIAEAVLEVIDRENMQPHNQVFVLAHVLATCAVALGAGAGDLSQLAETTRLARTLLDTRLAATTKLARSVIDGGKR